jgi:hypothetical protein
MPYLLLGIKKKQPSLDVIPKPQRHCVRGPQSGGRVF